MKKTAIKVLIVSTFTLLYSCGNQTKENQDHKKTEKVEKTTEQHHSKVNSLVLDNGKLWTANQETTTGVNNMIILMNSFTDKDDVNAYNKLTKNLKLEFTIIFEKCNMTGEAHNQLHNFLVPIKDLFVKLSSNDLNKCKESYSTLKKHLAVYKNYFE